MSKYVKWRNKSFQTSEGNWVPEASVGLIEGSTIEPSTVSLSATDSENLKQGKLTFPTAEQAKAAAYEMVKRAVWNKWGIHEEEIQEY